MSDHNFEVPNGTMPMIQFVSKVVKCVAVAAFAFGLAAEAGATWQYDAGTGTISDGNWTFAVSTWLDGATTFRTTAGSSGRIAGAGVLDIAQTEADLGREWSFQTAQFKQCTTITRIVLPDSVASLPNSFADGCSALESLKGGDGLVTFSTYTLRNCTKLATLEPAFWDGTRAVTLGEQSFLNDSSLMIEKFVVTPNVALGWHPLQNCSGIRSVDYSQRTAAVDLGAITGSGITNLVLAPKQQSMSSENCFVNVQSIYATSNVITSVSWRITDGTDYKCRFFCDPQMDSNWQKDTIAGYAVTNPTEAEYASYVTKYGVTREQAEAELMGIWKPNANGRLWLVKWKSPFNHFQDDVFVVPRRAFIPESGSVTLVPSAANDEYEKGTTVTATAVPAEGYVFSHWRGTYLPEGVDVDSPSMTFAVDDPYAFEAVFTNKSGWYATPAEAPTVVTDGNWAFRLQTWAPGAESFTTVPGADGWLGGDRTLDIARAEATLGRTWTLQSSQFGGVKPVDAMSMVLPSHVTSLPSSFANGCERLVSITASENLTSFGKRAFTSCTSLQAFEPAFWEGDRVCSFGEEAFSNDAALEIDEFVLAQGAGVSYMCFGACSSIRAVDYSQMDGNVGLGNITGLGIKRVKLPPKQYSLSCESSFVNVEEIYVLSNVFTTVGWSVNPTDYACRVFVDPMLEPKWFEPAIAGFDVIPPTSTEIANYAEKYEVTEAKARKEILGIWKPNASGKMWIVKWASPLRKPKEAVILIR